jgi:hypothetical protein
MWQRSSSHDHCSPRPSEATGRAEIQTRADLSVMLESQIVPPAGPREAPRTMGRRALAAVLERRCSTHCRLQECRSTGSTALRERATISTRRQKTPSAELTIDSINPNSAQSVPFADQGDRVPQALLKLCTFLLTWDGDPRGLRYWRRKSVGPIRLRLTACLGASVPARCGAIAR